MTAKTANETARDSEWQPENAAPLRNKPKKVLIVSKDAVASEPILFDGVEFRWNADPLTFDYDALVVYDELPRSVCAVNRKALGQTVLVTSEPYTIKRYPPAYTRQFGAVLTSHPDSLIRHKAKFHLLGAMIPYYTPSGTQPTRERLLSTVCSSKAQTHTAHARRLNLVRGLKALLPELDWYGHGVVPLASKADALEPYRYHIAVENHIQAGHMTEKPTDVLSAGCFLFYAGDPDFGDSFPTGAFRHIPLDDAKQAAEIIREAIADNAYEKGREAIRQAQDLIRTQYNTYARVLYALTRMPEAARQQACRPVVRNRRALRKTPCGLLSEICHMARYRIGKLFAFCRQ